MRVADGVRRACVTIDAADTIYHAAEIMESLGVGSVVVVDQDGIVGIVTDRDLVRRALAKSLAPDARIDGVMSTPVLTLDASADLTAAFALFHDHPVRRLVVTSAEGEPVGVLTVDDLMINLVSQLGDLARPVTAETIFGQRDAPVPVIS